MGGLKERPILFSGEMVKAILDGRKTQTRRPLRQQPIDILPMNIPDEWVTLETRNPNHGRVIKCRFGIPGDRLWVRETFTCSGDDIWSSSAIYAATPDWGNRMVHKKSTDLPSWWREGKKMPSIFMPRWASRITLEITGVRVERVQAISYADALAEGVWRPGPDANPDQVDREYDARVEYHNLWNEINAERGFSWMSNPWVWVIEFRRVVG